MPVYDYRCNRCAKPFEIRCGIKDSRKGVRCPTCNGRDVTQTLGSFTALGLSSKRKSRGSGSSCSSCSKSSCSGCSH
ncbi:MAG TPA: zinc ribbon domain-containing protein [Armatimonadota bacterium]|nr:zinc ribbon domain-containing protein [Armatimonadota bacterium]HQK93107.1 zinc ribbon domain-containing protein [Armatimonadota bacterium]